MVSVRNNYFWKNKNSKKTGVHVSKEITVIAIKRDFKKLNNNKNLNTKIRNKSLKHYDKLSIKSRIFGHINSKKENSNNSKKNQKK